jgi:hypothetical protein
MGWTTLSKAATLLGALLLAAAGADAADASKLQVDLDSAGA